jgi:hypothetical protein
MNKAIEDRTSEPVSGHGDHQWHQLLSLKNLIFTCSDFLASPKQTVWVWPFSTPANHAIARRLPFKVSKLRANGGQASGHFAVYIHPPSARINFIAVNKFS